MNIVRDTKGFTLLEVVLAVSIFSIALLLFSAYFVQSFTVSKTNDRELVAMNLARQYAEQYKHMEYDYLEDPTNNPPSPIEIDLNGSKYKVEIVLEKVNPVPQKTGSERIIQPGSGANDPIFITVNVLLEGTSSPLATVHTMVVNLERTS